MAEPVRPATGAAPGQDPNLIYALGSSPGGSARLQSQAVELAADSAALLDRVGLRPGQAAIDLGCGPRGILDLLAGRVAPAGHMVGLDADPARTAMAARFAAQRGSATWRSSLPMPQHRTGGRLLRPGARTRRTINIPEPHPAGLAARKHGSADEPT